MELELVECHDDAVWDAFVRASPQGNVFCASPFLAALGVTYRRYFVMEKGAAQLGALVLERDGVPLPAPHCFSLYHGVMLSAEVLSQPMHSAVPEVLQLVDFLLVELAARWPAISFCLHPTFPDLRSFQWFHYHETQKGRFQTELRYTGLLDLQGSSSPRQQMRILRHREHRRASAAGLSCEPGNDIEVLDRLHELTFQRQGIERPLSEVCALCAIAAAALAHGFGKCFVARMPDGQIASAALFLHDERTAYYLIGANDPEFRKLGAASFLMIEIIEHYRRAGQQFVDFVGVNSPNRGDFKTSFGARPVPYFEVAWTRP